MLNATGQSDFLFIKRLSSTNVIIRLSAGGCSVLNTRLQNFGKAKGKKFDTIFIPLDILIKRDHHVWCEWVDGKIHAIDIDLEGSFLERRAALKHMLRVSEEVFMTEPEAIESVSASGSYYIFRNVKEFQQGDFILKK